MSQTKKTSLFLTFCFLASFTFYGQNKGIKDLTKYRLQGNVESYEIVNYTKDRWSPFTQDEDIDFWNKTYVEFYKDGTIKQERLYFPNMGTSIYNNNEAGQRTEIIKTDQEGNLISTTEFSYNKMNLLTSEIKTDSNGKMVSQTLYKYDSAGKILNEQNLKASDVLKENILYVYDKKGNLIEEQRSFGDEKGVEKKIYAYNSKNQKIEETHYSLRGEINWKFVYAYDNRGNLLVKEALVTPSPNVEYSKEVFEYDEKNREIKKTEFAPDGKIYKGVQYFYNDADKITASLHYNHDGPVSINKYYFDENGLETSSESSSSNQRVKLTRDEQGNIIKSVTNIDGKLAYFSHNKITYYQE